MVSWAGRSLLRSRSLTIGGEAVAVAAYLIIFVCIVAQFLACFSMPIRVTLTSSSNATNATFVYPAWFNHSLPHGNGSETVSGSNGSDSAHSNTTHHDNSSTAHGPGNKPGVLELDIIRRRMKMTVDGDVSYWDSSPYPFVNATFLDGLRISEPKQKHFADQLRDDVQGPSRQLMALSLAFPIALATGFVVLLMSYTVLHHDLKAGGITSNTMDIPCFGKCHKVYIFIFAFGFSLLLTLAGLGVALGLALSRTMTALDEAFTILEPRIDSVHVDHSSPFVETYAITIPFAFLAAGLAAYLTWRYDAVYHPTFDVGTVYGNTGGRAQDSTRQPATSFIRPEMRGSVRDAQDPTRTMSMPPGSTDRGPPQDTAAAHNFSRPSSEIQRYSSYGSSSNLVNGAAPIDGAALQRSGTGSSVASLGPDYEAPPLPTKPPAYDYGHGPPRAF